MDMKSTSPPVGFAEMQMMSAAKGVPIRAAQSIINATNNTNTEILNKSEPELSASYSYNNDANLFVVKILDDNRAEPNNVVKQIPPEYMIELAKESGKLKGNVINTTV